METRAHAAGGGRNPLQFASRINVRELLTVERIPAAVTAAVFLALFLPQMIDLARDWWTLPEAGHGLLLGPVAFWLAYKAGIRPDASPQRVFGIVVLIVAVFIRCAAGLAAELFSMRASMV